MNHDTNNPYEEGKFAYEASKRLSDNPYNSANPYEIDNHQTWEQGWLDAYINNNPLYNDYAKQYKKTISRF